MKAELREVLGKAAFDMHIRHAELGDDVLSWDMMSSEVKEQFMDIAESVIRALAGYIGIPVLQMLLTEADIKEILAQLV